MQRRIRQEVDQGGKAQPNIADNQRLINIANPRNAA